MCGIFLVVGGSGLGLSIVKRITTLMGGTVYVRVRPVCWHRLETNVFQLSVFCFCYRVKLVWERDLRYGFQFARVRMRTIIVQRVTHPSFRSLPRTPKLTSKLTQRLTQKLTQRLTISDQDRERCCGCCWWKINRSIKK